MLCFTIVWDSPEKEKVAKWSPAPASILEGFNEIYVVYGPKLSGTGDSQRDSRESFAIEIPIFIARQADSHKSLEFPIRANHATKGPKNPTKHGKNAKVAKSTRVCPPTISYFSFSLVLRNLRMRFPVAVKCMNMMVIVVMVVVLVCWAFQLMQRFAFAIAFQPSFHCRRWYTRNSEVTSGKTWPPRA